MGLYRKDIDKKLDQDIVMTLAQISHLSRFVREGYRTPARGTIPAKRDHKQRVQRTFGRTRGLYS